MDGGGGEGAGLQKLRNQSNCLEGLTDLAVLVPGTMGVCPASKVEAASRRLFPEWVDLECIVGDRMPLHEVFLDDSLQNLRSAGMIPNTLGIDDRNRSPKANLETVRLGSVDQCLGSDQSQFLETTLQILPCDRAGGEISALGLAGFRTKKDMTLDRRQTQGGCGVIQSNGVGRHRIQRKRLCLDCPLPATESRVRFGRPHGIDSSPRMTLSSCFRKLGWVYFLGFVVQVAAQNGDHPNEVQKEVVPKEQIPPAPVRSPEEEARTFSVAPGFHVELVASEPLVTSPVAMQFDHQGRLWVVEMNGYMPNPDGKGEQVPNGNIVILEDTDGDGKMDKRTVFLDHLVMPRAVMPFLDGVIYAEPTRLLFARDRSKEGKPPEKFVIAENYAAQDDPKLGSKANPEHASNSPLWALDNWVYSANHPVRYRWLGGSPTNWLAEETIARGQWGLSQDDVGRLFHNSNSDQLRADLVPSHYLSRNPNLRQPFGANVQLVADQRVWSARVNPGVNRGYQPGQLTPDGHLATYTAACGPWVYRGDQLGDDVRGNAFLCEPAGNLVRRNRLISEDGILVATNAYDRAEFITSTDERFRPVNLTSGPDGALYVVDFYRGLIQHRIYLTSYLRQQIESRQLEAPVNLGRLWRVVRDGRPKSRSVLPANPGHAQLVEKLSHPNGWWRDCAQRLLVERRDTNVVPLLRTAANPSKSESPLGRLHALWTLEGLGQLDLDTLALSMDDPDSRIRVQALRLAEPFFRGPERDQAVHLVLQRAGFFHPDEQLQVLLTLGEIREKFANQILATLVMNTTPNRLRVDAVLSGLAGRELEFLEGLIQDPACATMQNRHTSLLSGLARCVTYESKPDRMERLLVLASTIKTSNWAPLAILDGIVGTVPASKPGQPPPKIKPFRLTKEPVCLQALRSLDSADVNQRLARLDPMLTWPGRPGAEEAKEAPPLTGEAAASFARGKEIYAVVCGACHQPHGNGLEGLAPPLRDSEWALGSEQRLARIVLHGVRDEISVKGGKYALNMPSLAEALNDGQIADVLTYVRREWGHTAPPVTETTIASVRAATHTRDDAWTEPELLKVP